MRLPIRIASVCAALAPAVASLAQSITPLGFLPGGSLSQAYGISADGRVVVGYSTSMDGDRAFRWTSGVMDDLGVVTGHAHAYAWAVSADGTVPVGSGGDAQDVGVRWAPDASPLGTLSGGATSTANAASADGSVVVGQSDSAAGPRAFRWTAQGMEDLGTLTGHNSSTANGVNADGSVIVGLSGSNATGRAFRWTGAGMQSLGVLPGGTASVAYAVTPDGAVVVGFSRVTTERAFRWQDNAMEDLGVVPGGTRSLAYAVSADGSVVVGRCTVGFESHAFLWSQATGMVNLNTYLPALGINLSEWLLQDATAISADGLTIAGNGIHNGFFEGYVVRLAPECVADFNNSGGTPDDADVAAFFFAWNAGDPGADVNRSGGTPDDADIAYFFQRWNEGC